MVGSGEGEKITENHLLLANIMKFCGFNTSACKPRLFVKKLCKYTVLERFLSMRCLSNFPIELRMTTHKEKLEHRSRSVEFKCVGEFSR